MPRKLPQAITLRRPAPSRAKASARTTSTRVSMPRRRSGEVQQGKTPKRTGGLMRRLRIPHATCLKKQPARTSPTRSPTKPRAQTLPELGTDAAANTSTGKCSGLKDKWSKLDEKWNKCRPYVERINGTIVPLRSRDEEFEERFAAIERSRTV